jgi:predicted acetyltransferase
MDNVFLIEPAIEYKLPYLDMLTEWNAAGEKLVPWVLRLDASDFESLIFELAQYRNGSKVTEKIVESSTFWLVNSDRKILGVVNIRHRLNENLQKIGGHIGYGIRPSERRKGYATKLLGLALDNAKELGITTALVTCDKDNIGSARTIMNNGGILDSEEMVDGNLIQRYWIRTANGI